MQSEQARSISSLLCDQKSCECCVKTQQGVSSPLSFLRNPNQNDRRLPDARYNFLIDSVSYKVQGCALSI